MTLLIKLEQLALLAGCYLASLYSDHAWWLFPAFLLTPDISMLGYAINNRWGAFCYNLFHHQGVAIAVIAAGWMGNQPTVLLAGLILLGHSAMDRVFGYGLKYASGFRDTHLGRIGNTRATTTN